MVPMDLSIITMKLKNNFYRHKEALIHDINLVASNALDFNDETNIYFHISKT